MYLSQPFDSHYLSLHYNAGHIGNVNLKLYLSGNHNPFLRFLLFALKSNTKLVAANRIDFLFFAIIFPGYWLSDDFCVQ